MTDEPKVRAAELAERLRRDGHLVTLGDAVSEATAAEIIGVSARTLRAWRAQGKGPPFYMASRAFYSLAGIVQFLDEHGNAGGRTRQTAADRGKVRQIATLTKRKRRR